MKNNKTLSMAAALAVVLGSTAFSARAESHNLGFNQLPEAVQTTVRSEIGDQTIAMITDIKQETKRGQTAYLIKVERKGLYPEHGKIVVSDDGRILKESKGLAKSHPKMPDNGATPASSSNPQ
jgi:hypothetical protein